MNKRAIFGISYVMSVLSSVIAAVLFAWPWLRTMDGEGSDLASGATQGPPFYWAELFDSRDCLQFFAESMGIASWVRTGEQRHLGRRSRVDIQFGEP
jgi:hypothetical protein